MTNLFSKQAQREQKGLCKPRGEGGLNHNAELEEGEQLGAAGNAPRQSSAP